MFVIIVYFELNTSECACVCEREKEKISARIPNDIHRQERRRRLYSEAQKVFAQNIDFA